jgi:hypothetical protein
MATTDFALNTIVFTVHDNEFRSSKIQRIVIDTTGTNYILLIDGQQVEKQAKQIDKTKEGLFNKMVDRFTARRQA